MTPLEPYPKLAKKIGLSSILFKREDLHPYGSHKGRSIPVMIDHYYKKGDRSFAISSSGNAALAAAKHVMMRNQEVERNIDDREQRTENMISLDIFVGNHISGTKLERLQKIVSESETENPDHIRILRKERPLQALTQAVQEGMRSLRQSTDDIALLGYESLAVELVESNNKNKIGALFTGTSSGTTAQALAQYFSDKKIHIQVHIVQTSSCHPLANEFESYDGPDEISTAGAIVDQTALRKSKLIPLIKNTGGYGWIATNDDIRAAQELVQSTTGLNISTNSALSVAGAMKAVYTGHEINGAIVCMICGD
jgi:threonine dehydratase